MKGRFIMKINVDFRRQMVRDLDKKRQEIKKSTPKNFWPCIDWETIWIDDGIINAALKDGYVDRITEAHAISAENLTEWRMAVTAIEKELN